MTPAAASSSASRQPDGENPVGSVMRPSPGPWERNPSNLRSDHRNRPLGLEDRVFRFRRENPRSNQGLVRPRGFEGRREWRQSRGNARHCARCRAWSFRHFERRRSRTKRTGRYPWHIAGHRGVDPGGGYRRPEGPALWQARPGRGHARTSRARDRRVSRLLRGTLNAAIPLRASAKMSRCPAVAGPSKSRLLSISL
jgi:hypothetical protein